MKIKKFNEGEDFKQEPIGGFERRPLKTVKIVNIWDLKMPDKIKEYFFDYFEDRNLGNNSWVSYDVGTSSEDNFEDIEAADSIKLPWTSEAVIEHGSILDKWLLETTELELNEEIFINHQW